MTLNFPDSPSTGDIYNDSTSGFQYEWNGTVWISTDPQRAANIKELDDISGSFNGSTTQFNLRVSSSAVEPVSDAQLLISVGGVMQNPTNDYTVSGSTITFTTAPSAGLTFFGVFLGQALSLNTVQDGTVEFASFKTGTAGVGIQSAGSQIGVGITNLNFIGTGNTFVAIGNTVNVSVNVGGIDTTGTSHFNNIIASGNLNVTGDLVYDEVTAVNQKISGVTTTTGLDVLGISSVKDLRSVGVTTLTSAGITNLTVSAASTFTGAIDANGGADISGGSGLVASTAKVSDLTSGRVTYAGGSGELQDNAGLTFDGTTLAATRLAAPVAFTTSLTAANITFDKSTDDLIFADGAKAVFGTGLDLSIFHDSGWNYIQGTANSLAIQAKSGENSISAASDGNVQLYFDGTSKIQTTSVGVNVVGNVDCDSLNNAGISTFTGAITAGAAAFSGEVDIADGQFLDFGNGNLKLRSSSNSSYIVEGGTGKLYIYTNELGIKNAAGTENLAYFAADSDSALYYDNTLRIKTTGTGINVVGNVDCDSLNNAGISTFTGDATFNGGAGAISIAADSDIRFANGSWSGEVAGKIQQNSNKLFIQGGSSGWQFRSSGGTGRWEIDGSGHITPVADSTYDIGTNSVRVRNFYADTVYGDGSNLTGVGGTVAPLEYNPDVGDTGVLVYSGIGATFNQAVKAGSGNVTISVATNAGAAGTVFENFAIGSSATFGTSSFYVTPTNSLTTNETFRVDIPASAITNMGGDAMPATSWTFQAQAPVDKLMVWGRGEGDGNLGLSNNATFSSPVQVPGTTWDRLAPNAQQSKHQLVRKTDGTLWSWGYNITGALGLGNRTAISSPQQIGSGTNWARISRGYYFSMGTKTDGSLWAWGRNDGGELGLSSKTQQTEPAQVGSDTTWSTAEDHMGPGYYFSNHIKANGTLWSWGMNGSEAPLGLSNGTDYSSPKQIGSGTDWAKTGTMGRKFGHAVKTNGALYCWGDNTHGQLAANNRTQRNAPQQVPGTTWRQGCAAADWAVYTKTDNTLWAWGQNDYGQVGINQPVNSHRSSPVQIPGTTWSKVKTGTTSTWYAVKTDGTLWGCGRNTFGELGQNDQLHRSSPVQIGSITPEVGYNDVAGGEYMGIAQQTDISP